MLKNIGLMIVSLLLTLAAVCIVGEVLLRRAIKYEMSDMREMYARSETQDFKRELKPDYKGIYYGHAIEINSGGFRDYEYSTDKPEGVYRIALLGDSMCFGQGLALEDIYAKVLERILNVNNSYNAINTKRIEVLNFSVPGHNTLHEYEYLKGKVIFYKPDLVLLNFFLNDILPKDRTSLSRSFSSSLPALYKRFINGLALIKARSYFAQYALSRIAALARRVGIHGGYISEFHGAYEDDSELWLECQREILKIKRFTDANNLELLVAIIPFLSDLNKYHPLEKEMDIVVGFCRANNIDSINLLPYFYRYRAESLWINPINGHPNEKAHQIMARAVSGHILNK